MKVTTSQILVGAIAPLAGAFPAAFLEKAAQDPRLAARANEMSSQLLGERAGIAADSATALFEPVPQFSESQLIDVSDDGPNPWIAPGPNDLRGPCPGLNAFANHGFLPRNGYATITQFREVTEKVVGMGEILADFLAVLGASIDGDGTSWSIGGTPPAGVGGPLAQQGHGISGSHNKYESDASPTRGDLYQSGDDYKLIESQFNELIAASPGGFVDLNTLTKFRSDRFDHQVATNPYFFNGPFTGVLVQPAAYTFIYRFMANHSGESTQGKYGILSYDTLADWFGVYNNGSQYVLKNGKQGQERIPYNWYRRSFAYPYETTYFTADAANAIALYPKFANVGGNLGQPNSFAGVDITNLSGGVYNSQNLASGNNFACLAYQFSTQVKPDLALGALNALGQAVSPIISDLGCPQLKAIDDAQLKQFPGYTKSNVAP